MRIARGICLLACACLLASGCAGARRAEVAGDALELPYAPSSPPKADDIYHVPTGLKLSFADAMEIASAARLVCVGETHDNRNAQRVELLVLRELVRRHPGKVAIGMEMFREPQQGALDNWVRGGYAEEVDFLRAAGWYGDGGWGYDYAYYRDILAFAREKGIDVVALNPSRELEMQVSRSGLDNLAPALASRLPSIGEIDPIQKGVLKGIFGGHAGLSESRIEGFLRTQTLWEETMAERVVEYLRSPRGEGKRFMTITGGWHVRYGFGLPKKVVRRMPMAYTVIQPEEFGPPPDDGVDRTMEAELPDVPLLPADFVWFVPYESLEGKRVRIGARLEEPKGGGVAVAGVVPGSPGEAAGLRKGDRILSVDGKPARDAFDVVYAVTRKGEGDTVTLVVRSGEEERTLPVRLFRMKSSHPAKK